MKIEIPEKSTPKFYDEFLYIVNRYKKIKKNPRKKVRGLTEKLVFDIFGSFLCLVLFLIYYKINNSYLELYFAGSMFFVVVLFIVYYIQIHKLIKAYMSEDVGSVITIDKNGISLNDGSEQEVKLNWDLIEVIVINKYSICILPKRITSLIISFDVEQKELFLQGIKKYRKEGLIVDNSKYYKKVK